MNNNNNEKNFRATLTDLLGNIKSLGTYSASNLSFWHPLVTPSEYKHQNLLHQYPEYEAYFKLYLKLKNMFSNSLSVNLLEIYMEFLQQKKFGNSKNERNFLYFVEFCFLIENNQKIAKTICQILREKIEKIKTDDTFTLPVFSAVYLIITDKFGEIPSDFLKFIAENLFELPVFENSKNKLLFSNFLPYAFENEVFDTSKYMEMLQTLDFVPLSGTYNNFMQVVRLKYDVKPGSKSDRFFRDYNLQLLDNFSNCENNDFSINNKFKIHNQWRGRNIVLKTLDLLSKNKNLSTNIFEDLRESTLWFIIRNLWHVENDTLEKDLTSKDLHKFSEQTLLKLAFLSPSFAYIVEEAIELKGLEQLAFWNISHNSVESLEAPSYPYIKHSQNAILDKVYERLCLSFDQQRYDRIEISWFRKIQDIIGDAKLKKLLNYFPLPFPEKRTRTQEFAELLLTGKMKSREDIARIIQKYPLFTNKDKLNSNLKSVLKYLGEVLVSSKAKKLKILPKIWAYLDNTAKYFNITDANYLLLPLHINVLQKPERQKMKVDSAYKSRKKDVLVIKAAETLQHRLKTVVWKRGRIVKRVSKEIKQSKKYLETESKIHFINAFIDKLMHTYESRIVKNRFFEASHWLQARNTASESLMKTMIFNIGDNFGFIEFTDDAFLLHTVEGDEIEIADNDVLYLSNPQQIHDAGKFEKCAKALIEKKIHQPTPQVFSEVCSQKDCAKIIEDWQKIKFSQSAFNDVLKRRGWNVNTIGYICKYDNTSTFLMKVITQNDSKFPLNPVINSIENVTFYNLDSNEMSTHMEVDESMLYGIFDDLHLALASSTITPLTFAFSPALQMFVLKYLENEGFKNVRINANKLSFELPGENKKTEIILDKISPLTSQDSEDLTDSWEFLPHSVSQYWCEALNKLKVRILEVYSDFMA